VVGDVRGILACVDWLMMWYGCMSREISLVGHTNISIDDVDNF
jgi:hypothetical protein